jgi:hypothetical protein
VLPLLSVYHPYLEYARTRLPATFLVFISAQESSPIHHPWSLSCHLSTASNMSQTLVTTSSSSNYQTIFDNAIEAYKKKTKKDLRSHPLLTKLETCNSPDAVLTLLREQIPALGQSRNVDDKLAKWLNPTVNVLYTFSGAIGGGTGLVNI